MNQYETTVEKAWLYEKYRLPYASEMVNDVIQYVGQVDTVADIGAGTGQLSRLFAPRCQRVFAVEPDPAMRAVAIETLASIQNIRVVDGSAEVTTLHDNSIDLIVIGNAYHRFRLEAIDELRRILKPSGWVATVKYRFLSNAFQEQLFGQLAQLKHLNTKIEKNWHWLPLEALFGDQKLKELTYPQTQLEDWEVFWGSAQSGIEAPEPDDEEFERFTAINRDVFDTFSVDGQIRIEYETKVLFGQPGV